jgi:hypothetical protein
VPGGDLERTVLEALRRMNAAGDSAERDYENALRRVRELPGDLVAELMRSSWESTPEGAYLNRWGLLQLLADLATPAATDLFDRVLSTPIPAERASGRDHRYSTVGEEVILRTTSVEGLRRLASDGDERAADVLLRHIGHEHRTVRSACVFALVDVGGDAEKSMREVLPEADRYLLEVRRTDLREVPQPTEVDHIRLAGRGAPVPPPA